MDFEQQLVAKFHRAKGVKLNFKPTIVDYDTAILRLNLISEELGELQEAIMNRDLVAISDALADVEYVIKGTAVSYGIDLEPIFIEVHRSNMSKLVEKREDGKVLRGENFQPPHIQKVLEAQGAKRTHSRE